MTIRKTSGGRWEARERTIGGRGSPRISHTFDRKHDAEQWQALIRRRRQLGQPLEPEPVTLSELVEDYWRLHAIPNLAPSTRAAYLNVWGRHLHPRLGERDVRTITPKVITRYRADLEHAAVGPATVRKALALLQSILSFAVVEERVDFNAAAAVRKPRYDRERTPHIFLPADVEALRARMTRRDATLVSLLAYAGPRPEEALRVTWADVGTEAVRITDTKRHRERWTPLLAPLAADLREWRLASGRPVPSAPVIPTTRGGGPWAEHTWRNWRRRVWRELAPAGSRPRDLRSSYITILIYSGTPMTTIATWAGTSAATIDKHYAGVIANAPVPPVPVEEQIRAARENSERRAG